MEYTKLIAEHGSRIPAKDRMALEKSVGELKAMVGMIQAGDISAAKGRFEAAFARYVEALKKNAELK